MVHGHLPCQNYTFYFTCFELERLIVLQPLITNVVIYKAGGKIF